MRVRALSARQLRRLGRALPRKLKFTREGKLLVLMTLGMGFAAVNSGNNLLYLIFGMQLALIIVSGILSELCLRGITAVRHEPPHLFAGTPGLVRVDLTNSKRRTTSLSVEVTELIDPDWQVRQRRGFVLSLKAHQSQPAFLRLESDRRGVVPSAGLRVATRFPFGFFEKSRLFPLPARYTVFPRVDVARAPEVDQVVLGLEEELAALGGGDEFYGLRDMRAGDDARDIAWKVTARRDEPVVREYASPATRRVMLLIANVVVQPPDEPAWPARGATENVGREVAVRRLERALSSAAGLATALSEAGYAVGVATADGGVAPSRGRAALTSVYEQLARVPVRTVRAGVPVAIWDEYGQGAVQTIGLMTADQRQRGVTLDADHLIAFAGEAAAAETP